MQQEVETVAQYPIPLVTESSVRIPMEAKVLGVSAVGDALQLNCIINTLDSESRFYELYVVTEGTKMRYSDSLGDYYGSFYSERNGVLHVFKRLY